MSDVQTKVGIDVITQGGSGARSELASLWAEFRAGKMTVEQFSQTDLAYAPPFGPTWDPTLTAANQLLKKL